MAFKGNAVPKYTESKFPGRGGGLWGGELNAEGMIFALNLF